MFILSHTHDANGSTTSAKTKGDKDDKLSCPSGQRKVLRGGTISDDGCFRVFINGFDSFDEIKAHIKTMKNSKKEIPFNPVESLLRI